MKNRIKNVRCEFCKFFKQDKVYKTEGICKKDNQVVKYFQVCHKLPTDDDKRKAKVKRRLEL